MCRPAVSALRQAATTVAVGKTFFRRHVRHHPSSLSHQHLRPSRHSTPQTHTPEARRVGCAPPPPHRPVVATATRARNNIYVRRMRARSTVNLTTRHLRRVRARVFPITVAGATDAVETEKTEKARCNNIKIIYTHSAGLSRSSIHRPRVVITFDARA